MARADGDRGDIVLGWLTRLTVSLAVLGLVGFDGISLAVGHVQTQDHANDAGHAAAAAYASSKDVQVAYDAALQALADDGAAADTVDPASFDIAPDGSVQLHVRHVSTTLLLQKLGPLRHYAVAAVAVSVAPPPK